MPRFKSILFLAACAACLWPGIDAPIALAAGIAFALMLGNPFAVQVRNFSGLLLKICVVGLGFGLPLATVVSAGTTGLWVTGAGVLVILFSGYLLARIFALDSQCGSLISAGTAICGGSAIAAVAPVIGARAEAISMSMACVFILNALALYLFPWVGGLLELTQSQFATWAAIAIHDTSSVVGAAATFGDQALAEATVLKLARALWIVPLVIGFLVFARRDEGGAGRITWPLFVALFVLAAGARTALPGLETAFDTLAGASRRGLVLVLFLIGSGLGRPMLRSLGWRPMAFAALLWLLVSSATLALVVNRLLPTV
ncbi:MAG TPA: putative sulfate exporter family transporter [Wenzhouxiangellaceae bacterium]|nr:putative sulfate exporter family transporter [Wenzhouxiangellaceae bacterium]